MARVAVRVNRNLNNISKHNPSTWNCMFCNEEYYEQHIWCPSCFPKPKSIAFQEWLEPLPPIDPKSPKISQYVVNYDHVKQNVKELADDIKTDDTHNGHKLLEIFDKINVNKDQLKLWDGLRGYDKKGARSRMQTVIDFAESNASCSKHIKQKLRTITRLIIDKGIENSAEYVHILLLIASHGSVCNVMKEVAIGDAYGLMTNQMEQVIKKQSLEEQILKVLRNYRVLLVEECFHSFKMSNNTHYIAGFHNEIADKIGVIKYNDPDICIPSTSYCKDWKKNLDKRYFAVHYTKEKIVRYIVEQIKEEKIGYQKIVKFMQDNCPKDMDKMEFLQCAIDIDSGKINEGHICWMLEKLSIFMVKSHEWKAIEKCWDDIKR